jgi:hypothetical protein
VVNASPENHDGPINQEIIYSGSVDPAQDPLIVVQGPDEDSKTSNDGHVLVLWKQSVVISRPQRLRLQSPTMVFSATANLKPAEQILPEIREDEYLPSTMPSGLNLLESFGNDPELSVFKPRLSALRVSRVAPATQVATDLMRPLKNISRRSIKVYPAFSTRVRYARPNTIPTNPSITASLDVDIAPFAGHEVVLESVSLTVTEGLVEDLNEAQGISLPMACLPRDDVTFLYRVKPDERQENTKTNVKIVQIHVTASVHVSESCEPHISMYWQTQIDFTPPVNSSFGQPSQPIRRDHRPAQLSIDSSSLAQVPTVASFAPNGTSNVNSNVNPDALPVLETTTRHARTDSLPDFGVTMTFTSPPASQPVCLGKEFTWQVFIVNRSDRARKLALMVIPRRRRNEKINHNRPPSTSGYSHARSDALLGGKPASIVKGADVADAVLDVNILHAMQKNSAMEAAELVCYSTDVRVGPLAPGACHTVELRFVALKRGVLGCEVVRVVDLATQEHVDVRDLPMVVVS